MQGEVPGDFVLLETLACHGHVVFPLIPLSPCCPRSAQPGTAVLHLSRHSYSSHGTLLQRLQASEDLGLPIMFLVQVIGENKNEGLAGKNWWFLSAVGIEEEHWFALKSSYSAYNAINLLLIFYSGQIKLWSLLGGCKCCRAEPAEYRAGG